MRKQRAISATALTLGLAAALSPVPAHAAATAQCSASVEILEPVQFSVLLDMDFGKVASNGTQGVIEIDPAQATRTCNAALTCIGSFNSSELKLTGSDANVIVTYDPTFTLHGPGQDMVAEPKFPGGSGAIIHLTGGSALVKLGARLHVNANQTPGVYSGTFAVNLEYN